MTGHRWVCRGCGEALGMEHLEACEAPDHGQWVRGFQTILRDEWDLQQRNKAEQAPAWRKPGAIRPDELDRVIKTMTEDERERIRRVSLGQCPACGCEQGQKHLDDCSLDNLIKFASDMRAKNHGMPIKFARWEPLTDPIREGQSQAKQPLSLDPLISPRTSRIMAIRNAMVTMRDAIEQCCPDCREKDMAQIRLDEAMMWAEKGWLSHGDQ